MPKRNEYKFHTGSVRFRIPFLFLIFQIACYFSYSQILDTVRLSDTIRYHVAITSTGSLNQSEKTNTYLMNNAFRVNDANRLFSVNLFSSYVYGLSSWSLTNNDLIASIDGNYYQQHTKFFYWIMVNYASSYSLKIKGLFQSGAGAAYDFIKTKTNRLNISDG